MPDDERQEIFHRLGDVEKELAGIKVTVEQGVRTTTECATGIKTLTEGLMGTMDKPGLVLRLDRLEQTESRRARILNAALLAVASLMMKAVWDLIAK